MHENSDISAWFCKGGFCVLPGLEHFLPLRLGYSLRGFIAEPLGFSGVPGVSFLRKHESLDDRFLLEPAIDERDPDEGKRHHQRIEQTADSIVEAHICPADNHHHTDQRSGHNSEESEGDREDERVQPATTGDLPALLNWRLLSPAIIQNDPVDEELQSNDHIDGDWNQEDGP
jgi:hypothetical protein